jgi:DNA-binding ferritin-like protein
MERAYEAVDGFIDRLAECLRKFGVVPAALSVYASCSVIKDELSVPSIPSMLVMASEDGAVLFELAQSIISVASQSKQEGVVNLLGDLCETLDTVVYLLKSGTL